MRRIGYMGAAVVAAMLGASPLANQFANIIGGAPKKTGKRRKSGEKYPFSSTRQNARYARQIAAGQLRMDGACGRRFMVLD